MASYLELWHAGTLRQRAEVALSLLESCSLCPRRCSVDRLAGETGRCRSSRWAMVSSSGPHFGEESPLVGRHGSGTIFFANCNLACIFCQNYSISQLGEGEEVSKEELASIMLSLQDRGCHNINLVSPTHVVPQILEALELAVAAGLQLPLVYNSGGYDSLETLRLLDGIVDIYMPDMKYSDERIARQLSGIEGYPVTNRAAVKEMHRQVGDLAIAPDGVAERGLLLRHLVLPGNVAGTREVVAFISREISRDSYVNIMSQYHPCHMAFQFPGLARPTSTAEFEQALATAREAGLWRLDQGLSARILRLSSR